MKRILASAAVAGAALLTSGTAAASKVAWSVTVGSHGGAAVAIGVPVVSAPVYAPVVVPAPPMAYPRPVVYLPSPPMHYQPYLRPVALPYHRPPVRPMAHGHRHRGLHHGRPHGR